MDRAIRLREAWVRKYVRRVASARELSDVLRAVEGYLGSWSKERVQSLQKMDGGWGPFDETQRPVPVIGVGDLTRIQADVRDQRAAIAEVGFPLADELAELDMFLSVCTRRAHSLQCAEEKSNARVTDAPERSKHQ